MLVLQVAESLLELIEMEAEYVRAETVVVMQDLLRKYPDRAPSVIPSLHRCLKRMEDPTGKAAGECVPLQLRHGRMEGVRVRPVAGIIN